MNVLMLCGSPRARKSNSAHVLEEIAKRLAGRAETETRQSGAARPQAMDETAQLAASCDALVIAFPLYVDGIPSGLYDVMERIGQTVRTAQTSPKLYVVVNNGFYDARQNALAIDMMWSWADACGLARGRALAIGAGEMVQMAPLGKGPLASIGCAVDEFAQDIACGRSADALFVEPNFPRFLYKLAGHQQWRSQAKANGLKVSALKSTDAGLSGRSGGLR